MDELHGHRVDIAPDLDHIDELDRPLIGARRDPTAQAEGRSDKKKEDE